MPTATGLPKKGERVRYQATIFGKRGPERFGTVVERGSGEYWTLYVRWDDRRASHPSVKHGKGVDMMVDAAYALRQGWLKVIS